MHTGVFPRLLPFVELVAIPNSNLIGWYYIELLLATVYTMGSQNLETTEVKTALGLCF